jgi:hypothetical protein
MNSASLAPFTASDPLVVFAAENRGDPESCDPAGGAPGTRSPLIGCTRMLSAGCYSVSLLSSGAGYEDF